MGPHYEMRRESMLRARALRKGPKKRGHNKKPFNGPVVTKERMLRAIQGTRGNRSEIARRLGVCWATVQLRLKQEGWEDVRRAWEEESDYMPEAAEKKVHDLILQDDDLKVALRAATWYLDRKGVDRGYGQRKEVTLQGGETPLKVESTSSPSLINVESLPLDVRRALLKSLEGSQSDSERKNSIRVKKVRRKTD